MSERARSTKELIETLSGDKARLRDLLAQRSPLQNRIRPYPRERGANGAARAVSSWSQQRLWFIDQLEGGGVAYNVPVAIRFHGALDREALGAALISIIRRHESLRTRFVNVDGVLYQDIIDECRFDLVVNDQRGADQSQRDAGLWNCKVTHATAPLDLSTGPLIRGELLLLTHDEQVLLLTVHHIVFDGWSLGVMLRELVELYAAARSGGPNPLPSLPIQYADYAQWQQQWLTGEILSRQLNYWCEQLRTAVPELELPTDRPRPPTKSYRGKVTPLTLDPSLRSALLDAARRRGMTLFMMLYAGWALLISRLSGQQDVVIGTPIANRRRTEFEGLIGFFVNTCALRISVCGDACVGEFLEQVRTVALGAFDHQDMPFERLVEALRPERSLNRHPVFQVMFVLQNAPQAELAFSGLEATIEEPALHTSKFDLTLSLEERSGTLTGVLNYDSDLFEESTIRRWIDSYVHLLASMTTEDRVRVADLPILTDSQRTALSAFNATRVDYDQTRLIHELVEEQACRTPHALAVLCDGQSLTYEALNAKANQLARLLRRRGAGANALVGICVERSLEMVIGILGILKGGSAYLPLDPNYPPERLQQMLEDARPAVVLTQSELQGRLPATGADLIRIEDSLRELAIEASENLPIDEAGLARSSLVYVIYTSGSTGRPKGIAMAHGSMVNLLEWHRRELPLPAGERVLQFAALGFDVAFQEMFSTLSGGGTLVLVKESVRKDVAALTELLNRQCVGRIFMPPLMLQSLAEHTMRTGVRLDALRDVITAGEQLRITAEIARLFEQLSGCRLHNHYGPTETHVVTSLTLDGNALEWPSLPTIGRPIANTYTYILDEDRRPVPIGVLGEIYLGGANLARGYLHRPELTQQRFVPDPFDSDPVARMYKTGDVGRWHTDGTIEYVGRNDDQVKIRGFRIELGEIESRLAQHEQVKDVVVVAREDVLGEKRLVAYLTRRDAAQLSVEQLRTWLRSSLPEHMIPSALVTLESLPLTPSGKLDRRALPPPDIDAFVVRQYEPPRGEVETILVQLWGELLGADRIGREDDFFDLGGHSLLVLRLLSRVNAVFGSDLKVREVYTSSKLKDLADRIAGAVATDSTVDLAREAMLPVDLVALDAARDYLERGILLTGATGFVGRFLLAQLLHDNQATVYCLVRANSPSEAMGRIEKTMQRWHLWRPEFRARIVAVPGDLRQQHLGVDGSVYRRLAEQVESVYHCGTSMNHLESYAMAKAANVGAAKELVRLATIGKPKLINYLSTLGVFNAPTDGTRRVDEASPIDQEKHSTAQGYLASKWVGEKVFMLANERGIPCNIFRLGLVWADTECGRYDESQRVYRVFKSCLLSRLGIRNYEEYELPLTPVDYVARAVVSLARQHLDGRGIFHISAPRRIAGGIFERCNEIAGTSLELMSYYDWIHQLERLHRAGASLPAVPLLEFLFSVPEAEFHEMYRRCLSHLAIDCEGTGRELERLGIRPPEVGDQLLTRCLGAMFARDLDLGGDKRTEKFRAG